ncbi:PREDICTED: odr-4 [Prunus dulcis]|uniref:PREDICTED: odr-4 n=1 Tax=Prunus dulcis TaxID=3755 RepID=A0A5E4F355_PRUDU|nr:PREDICTED: odr-4 [Prunus dulcis]
MGGSSRPRLAHGRFRPLNSETTSTHSEEAHRSNQKEKNIESVGLLIGKLSSSLDRGFVFDIVPTPPNDAGAPACSLVEPTKDDKRKGTKPKSQSSDSSSLTIDKDWVAEHARQVSRMLVGGMKVVGIYIWASESAFKNSNITLCQTVMGVAKAAPLSENDWDERLLIHICYSPRRWTCRNCAVASNITSSSLRPCDFKMGRVLNSLQRFRCMYNFDIRLPIFHKNLSNVQTFSEALHQGISVHAKDLKSAKAMYDGNLVFNNDLCTSDGLHEVELLLPFMKDTEACSQKEAVGVLALSGSVCSFAFLNPKEPISQAVADIKDDIITSLQSRLDIICDEADGETGPTETGGQQARDDTGSQEARDGISSGTPVFQIVLQSFRETCSLSLPRRVFVPWLAGTFVCDYLQPSETFEVLKDRCVELLSMEAPTDDSAILEPEIEAPSRVTKSFWDVAVPFSSASRSCLEKSGLDTLRGESSRKSIQSSNVNIIAAVIFLLLSIIVGYVLIFVRRS